MLTEEQSAVVNELHAVNQQISELKARQAELKKQVHEELFPNIGKGTNRIDLGTGWKLKATISEEFKLEKGEDGDFAPIRELEGELEAHIYQQLFSWSPKISTSAYKMLNEADKKAVDAVLTTALSNPTFTFEKPKEPKE